MRRHQRRDPLGNLDRAWVAQRSALRNHPNVFVFSIEAARQLQEEYVSLLANFLGGELPEGWERPRG